MSLDIHYDYYLHAGGLLLRTNKESTNFTRNQGRMHTELPIKKHHLAHVMYVYAHVCV